MVEQLEAETALPLIDIAAALASMAQGPAPLLLAAKSERPAPAFESSRPVNREREPHRDQHPDSQSAAADEKVEDGRKPRTKSAAGLMETFRIEVGSVHGIKPGNVVGAIANEAGIEGVHIGRVDIREDHSFVDLPEGMPNPIFRDLQKVRVAGRELRISRVSEKPPKPPRDTASRRPVGRGAAGGHAGARASGRTPARAQNVDPAQAEEIDFVVSMAQQKRSES